MKNTRGRSEAFPAVQWAGHWIAPQPQHVDGADNGFGSSGQPHDFSRVLYRKTFTIDEGDLPTTAPLRLTADSRYVLYVNGTEIGRGPIRSQPRRLRYDEYDIASELTPGLNSIAVLVTFYGRANSFWQPAVADGTFGLDALLVLEAKIGKWMLVSDDTWRLTRSAAWGSFTLGWIHGVPVESVDGREFDPEWMLPSFDDSSWSTASIQKTSHIGGFAKSQPPTNPYGALLPRGVAALTGDVVDAAGVTSATTRARPEWTADHPAIRVRQVLADAATGEHAPTGGATRTGEPAHTDSAALPLGGGFDSATVWHVSVDFGRIVAGFVELDLQAPEGTIVDLHYHENPWGVDPDEGISSPRTGARYIARGDHDEFRALEINGLRYIDLIAYGPAEATTTPEQRTPEQPAPAEVVITGIRMREYHYPEVGDAFVRTDDDEINRLYRAGIRTVTMNAFDSFTDCPTREQRAWVGDGVVHQMVHLTTNADWGLARNYLALGNSPRSDGLLPMTVVGDIEGDGGVTIPDWGLHWVHGVHNIYRYLGDRDEVAAYLPTIEGILRWYAEYVDEFGTISDVPEWNLVDWSSVFSTGRSSILTSLWARGLREFAELSDWLGNTGNAAWARNHYERARTGFEDFWDESRGRYVDHFLHGERMPASSQAAGATAIVSGLAPRERWSRIVDGITDERTLVVRSWIGNITGAYDQQKMLDQQAGIQRIDWDAEREVVKAEPFYSYIVHDAVAEAGRGAELLRLMRHWSEFLVDGFDTFGECWGWGTRVHGWSSTPTRDLVQHVLGIQPAEPGFGAVRFAPALGALQSVEASVPTPFGPFTLSIAQGEAVVDSPVDVVYVDSDGLEHPFAAGRSTIELR